MNNIMLDIETMGKSSKAAIIAIGAVFFDLKEGLGEEFYCNIDLETSMACGGVADASTIMWWLKQDKAAQDMLHHKKDNIVEALEDFADWCADINTGSFEDLRVWGNGAAFDNVILGNAYLRLGLKQPWPFWGDMCYRTIKNLKNSQIKNRVGVYHNALDDAKSQALHLIEMIGGE